jgi:hypothetical protein
VLLATAAFLFERKLALLFGCPPFVTCATSKHAKAFTPSILSAVGM